MTRLRPGDKMLAWKRERVLERLLARAGFLTVHGFLSDGERARVQRRLQKVAGQDRGKRSDREEI